MRINIGNILKRSAVILALMSIIGAFTGCGTVHGVGEDVQRIGEGLQQPFDR